MEHHGTRTRTNTNMDDFQFTISQSLTSTIMTRKKAVFIPAMKNKHIYSLLQMNQRVKDR
jgi:hypothetical protein